MEIVSITNARKDFFQLAESAVQFNAPVRITSKKGDVVMVSARDWEAIQETLFLNTVKEVRESIVGGMKAPDSDFVEDIGWDIG